MAQASEDFKNFGYLTPGGASQSVCHAFLLSLCYTKIMALDNLSQILSDLRNRLAGELGSQMVGLYLYGSHARGEARPDSDIDILIVVNGIFDYANLIKLTSETVASISLKYDVVISRAFLSSDEFVNSSSIFSRNVRREVVAI
jgi:uncharacterized protein